MAHAAAPPQVGRAAQALATPREVPHPSVVSAIDVAGRAGDVAVGAHSRVGGVVEDLFALQNRPRQQLGRHRIRRRDQGHRGAILREQRRRIADRHAAAHEILAEESLTHRIDQQALRSQPGAEVQRHDRGRGQRGSRDHLIRQWCQVQGIDANDAVVALMGDEDGVAQWGESDRARTVAVVKVAPRVRGLGIRGQIEDRDHRTHRRFMREIAHTESEAALDVVLLRHDRRLRSIRRNRNACQVIRHPRRAISPIHRIG